MKGLDPHLIRLGVLALIFVFHFVMASSRKQKRKNPPRPPQSAPLPPPIGSAPPPPMNTSAPPMNTNRPSQNPRKGTPDSPWSDLK